MVSDVGFLELLPRGTLCLNKTVLAFCNIFQIKIDFIYRYNGMLLILFSVNLGWTLRFKYQNYCSSNRFSQDPALQGFWDVLDFAWGDPNQYPDVSANDSGSTDSLDAHLGDGQGGGDDPDDPAAAAPAEPPSGAPSSGGAAVEPEPAGDYVIPFVPDYMVNDSQPVSVNPTDSEAETTPSKSPALSKALVSDPYEVPAASTGASDSVDAAVKDAQQQLLLAQIRVAR